MKIFTWNDHADLSLGYAHPFQCDQRIVATVSLRGDTCVYPNPQKPMEKVLVEMPQRLVLNRRQKKAIANLVYCHLIGEIDLQELQQ